MTNIRLEVSAMNLTATQKQITKLVVDAFWTAKATRRLRRDHHSARRPAHDGYEWAADVVVAGKKLDSTHTWGYYADQPM